MKGILFLLKKHWLYILATWILVMAIDGVSDRIASLKDVLDKTNEKLDAIELSIGKLNAKMEEIEENLDSYEVEDS